MTLALERRIGRLEMEFEPDPDDPFGLRGLSDDRFYVMWRDDCLAMLAEPDLELGTRATAKAQLAEIETKIRHCAAILANPEFAEHWRWVRALWAKWFGDDGDFVPPIAGPWWWPHDHPAAEMRWRHETRARPDIAALIAEGERGRA